MRLSIAVIMLGISNCAPVNHVAIEMTETPNVILVSHDYSTASTASLASTAHSTRDSPSNNAPETRPDNQQRILRSAFFGDLKALRLSIPSRADLPDDAWREILLYAVKGGNVRVIDYLLSLDNRLSDQSFLLAAAVDGGDSKVVKAVVKAGVRGDSACSALEGAIRLERIDLVKLVASVCDIDSNRLTSFLLLCGDNQSLRKAILAAVPDVGPISVDVDVDVDTQVDGMDSVTTSSSSSSSTLAVESPQVEVASMTGSRFSFLKHRLQRIRQSRNLALAVVSLAKFVDSVAYNIPIAFISDALVKMNRPESDAGYLLGIYGLGCLLAAPVVGMVSDYNQSRRSPMLVGLLALFASSLTLAFSTQFWHLLVARFVQGLSSAASSVAGLALIADIFPSSKLGKATALVMTCDLLGLLASLPLGGFLYQHVSHSAPYFVVSGLVILDLASRLLMMEPKTMQDTARALNTIEAELVAVDSPTLSVPSKNAFKEFLRTPAFLMLLFISAALNMIMNGLEITLPLYGRDRFGLDETAIGLLLLATLIPGIISSGVVGYLCDRFDRSVIVSAGLVGTAGLIASVPFPNMLWKAIMLLAFYSVTLMGALVPITPQLADFVKKHMEGYGNGQMNALIIVGNSIGSLIGPVLWSHVYATYGFQTETALIAGLFAMLVPAVWGADRLEKSHEFGRLIKSLPMAWQVKTKDLNQDLDE